MECFVFLLNKWVLHVFHIRSISRKSFHFLAKQFCFLLTKITHVKMAKQRNAEQWISPNEPEKRKITFSNNFLFYLFFMSFYAQKKIFLAHKWMKEQMRKTQQNKITNFFNLFTKYTTKNEWKKKIVLNWSHTDM